MTRFSLSNLRVRLIALVLLAIIPALGLILYSAADQRRAAADQAQQDALRLARLAAGNQDDLIEGVRQLLIALARLPEVRRPDAAACRALFADLAKQYPNYKGLFAISPDGYTFCTSTPVSGPVYAGDRLYFQHAVQTRNFAIGEYQVGRVSGTPSVVFAHPVLDDGGQVQAVVAASLDLGVLNRLAAQAQLPRGSTFTVIDGKGTVLARHPEPAKWVGQSVANEPLVQMILAQREGVGEALGRDDASRLYAFAPLTTGAQGGQIYLSIGIPKDVAFAEVNRGLRRNLLALGLVGMLALVAAWVGSDLFLLRRVRALVSATERLASGDLGARTGLPYGVGELSQLSRAFDKMADALEARRAEAKRAQDALSESEARYRAIIHNSADAIYLFDLETKRIVEANRAFCNLLGYTAEEARGLTIYDVVAHTLDDIDAFFRKILESEVVAGAERVWRRKDGTPFDMHLTVSKIRLGGEDLGFIIGRDITERKRAEAALAEQARLGAFGADVGVALTEHDTLQGMLQGCALAMVRHLDAAFARLWTFNELENILELQASAGMYTHLDGPHSRIQFGQFKIGLIAKERKPHLTNLVLGDPRVHDQEWAKREGMVAFAGYPLTVEDRLVGVMAMFARQPLSQATLDALGSVAVAIAQGIERKRVEEALRATSALLEKTFANMDDVVLVVDLATRVIITCNPAITRVFGYDQEEVIGRHVKLLHVDEAAHDEFRQRLLNALDASGAYHAEYPMRRTDGSIFPVEHTVREILDQSGRRMALVGVLRDITERKRTEESLRRSEKLAAMGELLAGVAHELNNPLAVIVGQTGLLRQMVGSGPVAERLDKVAQAADRCARIVKNFLALTYPHAAERGRVELNEIVQETADLLAYELRVDTVEVTLDLGPDLPVLWADPHQLQQVMVNLITNAHQAMRETSGPRHLTLTTRSCPGDGRVSLEVADTGPGISEETRSRIFEPFFTTKPPGRGTGLGLSLCQGIIEGHGGTIQVRSSLGQGTVFRIELPVEEPPATMPETREPEALPRIRGKRILVVDDEPGVTAVLADLLSRDAHHVDTAVNGAGALAMLGERAYDLILSDIRMPELDGPGFYREVARRHPKLSRRIIFITGDSVSPDTHEFLAGTGAPSLDKPFILEDVRQAVQRALRAPATL